MAGHSKFKNIQHRKGAQDKKRAKIFTKLVREIITSAKIGQPDPNNNPRLRAAITAARNFNLPKERIERAIASASEAGNTENYIEIRYEGFAPGNIAIIVEALTDNKNRTASDVRSAFTKFGGNLGETGSVSFMFDHVGIIQYPANIASVEAMLDSVIMAGARDVESNDIEHIVYTDVDNFAECQGFLINKYGSPEESHIGWKAQEIIMIEDRDKAEKLLKFIDLLEESDDVQRVFGNYELSDEIYEELLS
jgi:YebC/PmpR family DNA-binding regulatory protein